MKKLIRSLLLAGIIVGVLTLIVAFWRGNGETPVTESSSLGAPSRMLKMGPVVGGVVSTKTVGDVVIKMEASRLWFKKSKTFGFDNALFKKIAASDFRLTISKDGEKLLALNKEQVEMSADQNIIEINHPKITFPADMEQPDSIRLDNRKMSLHIRTGKSEKIWDLAKM